MRVRRLRAVLVTTALLLIAAGALGAAAQQHDADPARPEFWFGRVETELAAAPMVENGPNRWPRLAALWLACDLQRVAPSPRVLQLVRARADERARSLENEPQPLRKWVVHLDLCRVYGWVLGDREAYQRQLAAARSLLPVLPPDPNIPLTYPELTTAAMATAGDIDGFRAELSKLPDTDRRAIVLAYAADECSLTGQPEVTRRAVAAIRLTVPVTAPPQARGIAWHSATKALLRVGDLDGALRAAALIPEPNAIVQPYLDLMAAAHDAKRDDVFAEAYKVARRALPFSSPPMPGRMIENLAQWGERVRALETGRVALDRGAREQPFVYYSNLAIGLAAAGDEKMFDEATTEARKLAGAEAPGLARTRAKLMLAAAYARSGDLPAMREQLKQTEPSPPSLRDIDIADERGRLIDALLAKGKWDAAVEQINGFATPKMRATQTTRLVAAQAKAGVFDLATANARKQEGFQRCASYRHLAVALARAGKVAGLVKLLDELDTPLRRAEVELAVGQALAGKPVTSKGFRTDAD